MKFRKLLLLAPALHIATAFIACNKLNYGNNNLAAFNRLISGRVGMTRVERTSECVCQIEAPEGQQNMFLEGSVPQLPVSWSNRLGLHLTPIALGLWAAERPFVWNSIDVGGRSVIARMNDGSLLVHSPVEWTEELSSCIDKLGGGVGHIISPNYEHLKYTKQWALKYPDARKYACPGLPERMPEVAWTDELGATAPDALKDSIDVCHFDCEINPFTGKPFFNEVVFFHKKSKSMFCADVFWNYPASPLPNHFGVSGTGTVHECSKAPAPRGNLPPVPVPFGTTAWKFGMDQVYAPFYRNLMVGAGGERRERYRRAVETVLGWEAEIIVPCHGDVLRGQELCRQVLTRHFYP